MTTRHLKGASDRLVRGPFGVPEEARHVATRGDGAVTGMLHTASLPNVTLCGRPVVTVVREEINEVAWILGGWKICMKAAR